ncbi:hypothetical protein NS365_22920 [Aureimonas ureilytica]|uniref:DUF883 domain-containing protein n=1 Tax=Aureimonas ureilytica TaxID=401562 RepID=A0A175RG63_9HYPH|nr:MULTISPECIES: DUF883 family protein [Aureimonas]KTQ79386.1 hypothetical protein NS226_22985 [Aureimonas ureilytica]KTR00311.1 hypothetical protein NS365_22920 [Aureimonas ureilytica]
MSDSTPSDFSQSGNAEARKAEGDLESQVAQLREDVAQVVETLKTIANGRADDARSQAFAIRDEVRDRGERYLRQAQETAGEFEEQITERVRAEPIKSVLIAAAVGYVYARLFR